MEDKQPDRVESALWMASMALFRAGYSVWQAALALQAGRRAESRHMVTETAKAARMITAALTQLGHDLEDE